MILILSIKIYKYRKGGSGYPRYLGAVEDEKQLEELRKKIKKICEAEIKVEKDQALSILIDVKKET